MRPFDYQRPTSIEDAVAALAAAEDGAVLAGGHTLIPAMKSRLRAPDVIVDLSAVPGLSGVRREGDRLVIGAMTRHAEVAASPDVQAACPALAYLARQIGDPQVRNMGTIGGALANNDPAADYPAAVLAMNATIRTHAREIAADDFFLGMFTTALEPAELITAVSFPIPRAAGYSRFTHPVSRYALAGVFVARLNDGVRVAVTGAGPAVFRWAEAEERLSDRFEAAAVEGLQPSLDDMASDIHANSDYRAHICGVMLRRAVASCLHAGGG